LDWGHQAAIPQGDPEYTFSPENQFMETGDPYALGLALLKEGKLKPAIKAFEAATQKNPTNAEAWRYLGQCQAENEDERLAIAALLRCIQLDPYNLPALLMLGVSYTNDLAESRALNYLKTWMVNNSDYQGTEVMEHVQKIEEYIEMYGGSDGNFDGFLHEQVTKMFLKAAEINPRDADVFTVLGVLYHISSEFDLAIDAFRKAVEINPTDPTLWNKLGATQANSSKSAEAVSAYKSALQLRPTYVRALANLAIAFANQGLHEDAVRTYLATLKQNPTADHVWSYLRVSLSNMNRADLVKLTDHKDVELFREHFRF
jgi:peroxin-5